MARRKEPLARRSTNALLVAAIVGIVALGPGQARAQSQRGGGLSSLFGGLFSGAKANAPAQVPGSNGPAPNGPLPNGPLPNGPLPWSGDDGASGHPLMTADAIRQAALHFAHCTPA